MLNSDSIYTQDNLVNHLKSKNMPVVKVLPVLLWTLVVLSFLTELSCNEKTKDSRFMESFERRSNSINTHEEKQQKPRIVFTYPPEISWLDFRVGRVNESIKHPRDPEVLYVQKIDIGYKTLKTAVTGFASPIDPETLIGKLVVVLVNMKQERDQSILAHVRMMCARKGNLTEILVPPEDSLPGDLVDIEGVERKPVDTLNPKKRLLHRTSIHFLTNDKKQATYKGTYLWCVRNKGVIVAPTLTAAYIK